MDNLKRDIMIALVAAICIGFLVGLEVGCRTVRQYPDGSVETTEIDQVALAAFIDLAEAVLEYQQAHTDTPDTPQPSILESLSQLSSISQELQSIVSDGQITEAEATRLQELYDSVRGVLKKQGVNITER